MVALAFTFLFAIMFFGAVGVSFSDDIFVRLMSILCAVGGFVTILALIFAL